VDDGRVSGAVADFFGHFDVGVSHHGLTREMSVAAAAGTSTYDMWYHSRPTKCTVWYVLIALFFENWSSLERESS
jgi:hypothetical protein